MHPNEYATMFRVEETHWWYRAQHRLLFQALEKYLPDWKQKRILDAGCGTGAILKRLGDPAANVGIDYSPEAIAFCRRRGLTNVVEGDICNLPFPDESFDAVICSSVLYHAWIVDLDRALSEMRRVLRPGGALFINVPAFKFLHSPHDEAVMTARRFTRTEVRELLRKQNFQIRWITYWTTLLFPLALIARTLRASQAGRDFETSPISPAQRAFSVIMNVELALLRHLALPFGVALFAVARR